ncbi:MAG: AAA family ATPase [Thermoanaerobaculia bacterium]|nr:AAA family ATPase [Thermoanaerobaculia bacterium]
MQLENIAFRGYKAFAGGDSENDELQRLTLAPLTVVFGKNNSGKSAVVRLPRLLLGGLACNDERLLPLKVRGLEYGGRFVDVIHGEAFFRRPTFEVSASHESQRLDFSATLYTASAFAADKPPRIWSYQMRRPDALEVPPPTEGQASRPAFHGLLPADGHWDFWRNATAGLLDEMVHLGPMRAGVQAFYGEGQLERLGVDGREAPQWLRADPELADGVGSWFAKNMEGWRLSLSRSNESFSLQIGMSPAMTTNLARAGEGLQQVLPVVVHQLWRQRQVTAPFLDVVEQPELHLHAAAQAPLADLFIDTVREGRGKLLIETHSAAILLRIQRRVAEGLSPDLVALYFVEVTGEGSKLRRVALEPNGDLDGLPEGVFEEDFREVAAIRRAQRRRETSEAPA